MTTIALLALADIAPDPSLANLPPSMTVAVVAVLVVGAAVFMVLRARRRK